jgi:hypothetical protein
MSRDREEWTEAEWLARCQAGDREAWNRMTELFVSRLSADVARHWRHHPVHAEEFILDAVHDLFRNLWETPEDVFHTFDPEMQNLEKFLTQKAETRARDLWRGERRRHRREAQSAPDEEKAPRHGEIDFEDRVARLQPLLTPHEAEFLRLLLERRLSDDTGRFSPAARWQLAHRVREKLRQQDAADTNARNNEKR